MSNAVHEHGVDVEFEAERQHDRTVSPSLWREQDVPVAGPRRSLFGYSAAGVGADEGAGTGSPAGTSR